MRPKRVTVVNPLSNSTGVQSRWRVVNLARDLCKKVCVRSNNTVYSHRSVEHIWINERLGNEYIAAITYHQLGTIAEKRRDFDNSEKWYRKSLEIKERLGNEHGVAKTCLQFGLMKSSSEARIESARWTEGLPSFS